jgi:1-acyl-sn-glycerol-3-phosphate acyltransferase
MLYRTLELTLAPALRAAYRPLVTGAEHVPTSGPVILAANHVSFADELFMPLGARRQVFYYAKSEYFTSPGVRGRAMAAFFRGMGQVPVARQDPRSAAGVIEIGVEVLADGLALGIFPEGTRSPDGRLHKFRTGVARLATSSRPAASAGTAHTRRSTSASRCTSASAPSRNAVPGCFARSPRRSANRCRSCAARATSTPTAPASSSPNSRGPRESRGR